MKKIFLSCVFLIVVALTFTLFAQLPSGLLAPTMSGGGIGTVWQIAPVLLTTSPVDIVTQTVYLCYGDIVSIASASIPTVTIKDKGTPTVFPLLSSVPMSSVTSTTGQTYFLPIPTGGDLRNQPCRYMPGGITVSASANNVVSIYLRGVF